MPIEGPKQRDAYRRGAYDAYESAIVGLAAAEARALEQWLSDLDSWNEGEPPPPPHMWPLLSK